MRISFGKASTGSSTRYEVAWHIPQPELGGAKGARKNCWLLETAYNSEQAACSRLEAIEKPVLGQRGSVAVYEVSYDDSNKISSERIVAHRGGERPPFRHTVVIPDSQVRTAFAALVGTSAGLKSRRKPKRSHRTGALTFLAAAAIAGITGAAVFFTQPPSGLALGVASGEHMVTDVKPDRKGEGRILVPRRNSEMCDSYVFDNSTGKMRFVDALPCDKKKPRNITEHVNSFSAGWRSGR